MPTYDYSCAACGHRFERFESINDDAPKACPKCGKVFETWELGTPDLDFDPEHGDPGWVSAASAATCPHCGGTSCCSGLAAEREAWREL